ncbi:unnamed protein product [Adineta steineri]|uniref:Uncharacterized protein n=1 Tax=Adineta steineri TaxID=433720 RepID=A0A819RW51_9BILA|nr:unnamed protein product [Adineta steineri]
MLLLILLILIQFSNTNTCPIFCQCYSAFDGYHVACQNASLFEIPLNLIKFLQITEHQNLIVDLSSNFLSILSCKIFQISTIIQLILTKNKIESIPSCFSQSSIEILLINQNHLQFNQTTILSSSKLISLDISHNKILQLPRTFFFHLRRLRTLILNGENKLFEKNNDQWIRSLTTRNQLTIIICDENFHLPLCLFDNLFQSKKLFAIELNTNIHCDCSFVYVPLEKIHFQYCQSNYLEQQGKCNDQSSSDFKLDQSLIHLQTENYRQLCAKDYETCQNIQLKKNFELTTNDFDVPLSIINQSELIISSIKSSSTNEFITTTITYVVNGTSSKRENITAGAIIPLVLILLIVTIVCLYIILSGQFFKMKNREKFIDLINRRKKQQDISSVTPSGNLDKYSTGFNEIIPIENINMNSNRQNNFFQSYHQQKTSYSDDETDLTFYSIIDNNDSSTSFIQSSMTEIEIASSTSTINSSLSSETVVMSHENKQRIY